MDRMTDRTRIRLHPERSVPERIEEFLKTGLIAHVAVVEAGEPRVIPFLYHYESGRIYFHTSPASTTLALLLDGRTVAVSVAAVDELVASRSATYHTVNYRSVVAYGRAHSVTDLAEKRRVLEALTERYFPGRTTPGDYEPATDAELAQMALVSIEIEEASAKVREGGPLGPHDADPDAPGTAFVRSLRPGS